jgi:tryptophan-rich hypothetical protein
MQTRVSKGLVDRTELAKDTKSGPQGYDATATQMKHQEMNRLHPKKLLLTKWTAVKPIEKNKHFLVSKVIEPELPETAIEWVELEAVYSKVQTRLAWRDLRDASQWRQGWV